MAAKTQDSILQNIEHISVHQLSMDVLFMTQPASEKYVIFYSWQSDADADTNTKFALGCMKRACLNIEEKYEHKVKFEIDQATRSEAGSPNIPATILNKISKSDAIICDVTTITPPDSNKRHKVPNPNVTFELGYAVACLGWNRVILIFNKAYGAFPDDLPFDFDRHRVTDYTFSKEQKIDKSFHLNAFNLLVDEFVGAIEAIYNADPKKAMHTAEPTPEIIQRNRDLNTLNKLLTQMPLNVLEEHLDMLPDMVPGNIFHFWHGFDAIWTSVETHVYRPELKDAIDRFHSDWDKSLGFGSQFESFQENYRFNWKSTLSNIDDEERVRIRDDYMKLTEYGESMKVSLRRLVAFIKEDYLEIDLEETTRNANQKYREFLEGLDWRN